MSGAPSDGRSGLSFVLVTWTASVQFSPIGTIQRQHVYIHVPPDDDLMWSKHVVDILSVSSTKGF
jgi:hypothetical protein